MVYKALKHEKNCQWLLTDEELKKLQCFWENCFGNTIQEGVWEAISCETSSSQTCNFSEGVKLLSTSKTYLDDSFAENIPNSFRRRVSTSSDSDPEETQRRLESVSVSGAEIIRNSLLGT
eukprot:Sdes_comp10619_c0_seq1m2313